MNRKRRAGGNDRTTEPRVIGEGPSMSSGAYFPHPAQVPVDGVSLTNTWDIRRAQWGIRVVRDVAVLEDSRTRSAAVACVCRQQSAENEG